MSKMILNMPKIAQVISYYPPHLGGMENVASHIVEGLAEKGYDISVYTSNIGYSVKEEPSYKERVYYLKSIEFAHTPILFTLFFRLLTLPRLALIHLHVGQAFTPEIVYLISKLKGIPYIAHIHADVLSSGFFGFLLESYKKWFLKRVLKSAAKIICLSDLQKRHIAARYALPLASIVVIPNAVDEKYFIRGKAGKNSVPHLLFVGRLAVVKNLPFLIEAVSRMQTSIFLDIVGEGELKKEVEALIQKYGLQNVKLHGKKIGEELVDFYKSADVFVLPSVKEAFPLAMLEALAAGLPVVVSYTPDMQQILGGCGVLIQDPTATNYAEALDALLSSKEVLQRLSTLSVQKARSYSWKNVLNLVEDVYEQVFASLEDSGEGVHNK